MPQLLTTRLSLNPVEPEDRHALHEMWSLASVRQYLWDDEIIPLKQVAEIVTRSESLFKEKGFGLWLVSEKATKSLAGFCGLWYFFEEELPQLLYGLHPNFTGQGYATEASNAICSYAFEHLQFPYLTASCDAPNLASQRVANRLGMQPTGEHMIDHKPTVFFRINNPNHA